MTLLLLLFFFSIAVAGLAGWGVDTRDPGYHL